MHVPETAVDLNDLSSAHKNNIRLSWQVLSMQTVTEPHPMNDGTHDQFGRGVFVFDSRHVAAALLAIVYVGHVTGF